MRWTRALALSTLLAVAAPLTTAAAETTAAAPASIAELTDALKARYKDVKTLEADVVQISRSAMGDTEMKGHVYLSRPDKARWELAGSGYETLMVFDGATGWLYTPGTNQVIKMGGQAGNNALDPLELVNTLDERFDATLKEGSAELHVVEAVPKAGTKLAAQYKLITLEVGRSDLMPRRLVMADNYGSTTEIRFADPKVNGEIKAALFSFTPPAGADVVDGSL